MKKQKQYAISKVVEPIQKFIQQEKSGGIILGISVVIALILANSPLRNYYFHFFEHQLGIHFDDTPLLSYNLHHWINDGLMSIFFFVVGLELKREIVGGELSNPRKAILPIMAAVGGMIVPALIYLLFNPHGEMQNGWGIPMATDIAFALGVLFLLGNRIPLSLKIFLTALAIVDDLGAVLVIAFFYTSDISLTNLSIGLAFVCLMYLGNRIGIRSIFFYAILGIGGVWIAFLLSGVHATIAAVLAAFTIPADVKLREDAYLDNVKDFLARFKAIDPDSSTPALTSQQLYMLEKVKNVTNAAIPPLQRLEHSMHPFVTFLVIPIFALANAGVSLSLNLQQLFETHVIWGVALGLLIGKPIGIVVFTMILIKLKITSFPQGMNLRSLIGIGLLAGIGFTMSLFITALAFTHEALVVQAKIGIFTASLLSGLLGFLILRKNTVTLNSEF